VPKKIKKVVQPSKKIATIKPPKTLSKTKIDSAQNKETTKNKKENPKTIPKKITTSVATNKSNITKESISDVSSTVNNTTKITMRNDNSSKSIFAPIENVNPPSNVRKSRKRTFDEMNRNDDDYDNGQFNHINNNNVSFVRKMPQKRLALDVHDMKPKEDLNRNNNHVQEPQAQVPKERKIIRGKRLNWSNVKAKVDTGLNKIIKDPIDIEVALSKPNNQSKPKQQVKKKN